MLVICRYNAIKWNKPTSTAYNYCIWVRLVQVWGPQELKPLRFFYLLKIPMMQNSDLSTAAVYWHSTNTSGMFWRCISCGCHEKADLEAVRLQLRCGSIRDYWNDFQGGFWRWKGQKMSKAERVDGKNACRKLEGVASSRVHFRLQV